VNVTNGSLELDEGVSGIVGVDWGGFAPRTEVSIGADSTLVPVAIDPRTTMLVSTQRTIAVNTIVLGCVPSDVIHSRKWIVNGDKTMSMMVERCSDNTFGTVIPVGAVHALVTDTSDVGVAVIAKSIVDDIASWTELCQVKRLCVG
jgi:hypothetical protein